jgi:hypothetical protein
MQNGPAGPFVRKGDRAGRLALLAEEGADESAQRTRHAAA